VVMILLVMRIATQGLWPQRLLPTTFIVIAPPAVVGLALLQMGAPTLLAWGLWGMALFSLAWVATLLRRIGALPFGLPHWAMSFPLAALSALTLRLAEASPATTAMAPIGIALLAVTALIVAALSLATVRGLRDGSLLAPEPVASLVAAPPPGG
jgi:tellurite resistance protein